MSFMYALTLVQPPQIDVGELTPRAAEYNALAVAANTAASEVAGAVADIVANNEGPTTDGFVTKTTGSGSVGNHFVDLGAAATRTAAAYTAAATIVATAETAMDAVAKSAEAPFLKAGLIPVIGAGKQAQIVWATRGKLKSLESSAASQVGSVFATIALPSPFDVEYYSAMPPEVEAAWDKLSKEEKRKLLQLLSDQHCDRLGIPRVTLEFYDDPSDTSMGVREGNGKVRINEAYFDQADMMAVAVHETQHVAQYIYMDKYDDIAKDKQYLADVLAGRVPDPMMEQYGVSTEEVQRLRRGNEGYVRDKGYWERPVEVDARRSGDRFTDNLTIQEMEELVKKVK